MATLKDVAKLACVDVSTVSRALNNTSYVHPDTKARVYAAAKELGYHPNIMAQPAGAAAHPGHGGPPAGSGHIRRDLTGV